MTDDATYRKMKQERYLALAECERLTMRLKLTSGTMNEYLLQRDIALAECERLRADADRLDFVLANSAFIQITPSEGRTDTFQLLTQDEDENYIALSGEGVWFPTQRAAIDAARAKP